MHGLVVVITGGSRGIGRALARACVARGARVVTCARSAHDAEPGALAVAADVTRAADVARLVAETVARFGHVDVLVNNAAIAGDDLAAVLATNVIGADACARAVLAVNPAARIVNVSSGIVAAPRAGAAAYIASKHALEGLTRALACDAPAATIVAVELGAHATELAANPGAPPPEAAVPALLEAMTAPGVHGRILEAWRVSRALDTSGADLLAHPLGPSPAVRAVLADHARAGALERYPAGGALRKVVAALHDVPLDAIAIGAGASELIDRVLGVLARRGERIVANVPSWPLFPHLCDARGLVATTVPYRLDGDRVVHDLDAVLAAVDRTVRVVYLVSPSNPMGCALDAEPFARFLARLPDDVAVVVDEAYADFITRPDAVRAPAVTRRDPRVIAIRTFSKLHALAGLRIGYAVAAPTMARRIAAAGLPFAVTALAEDAAIAALGDREHARRTLALIARGRAARPDALASDAPFALALAPGTPRFFDGRYAMVPLWPIDVT